MRYFRRLPPFLRALSLLAILASIAGFGALAWTFQALQAHELGLATQRLFLGLGLELLGGSLTWPVWAYRAHLRRPVRSEPWLDSWRGQFSAALALAALPVCMLTVVLLVPSSFPIFLVTGSVMILSALVLAAVNIWALVRYYA